MDNFDVIIVGAGPSGYFCAYELINKNPSLKVLLIEKGVDIDKRHCPVLEHRLQKCPIDAKGVSGCYPCCSITSGFGGAGAFSDGKFNITTEFGGWLGEYLDEDTLLELINYVDSINLKYGATKVITDPYTNKVRDIEKKAMSVGVKLLRARVRHLGTEENLSILKKINDDLKNKITMKFVSEVEDIVVEDGQVRGIVVKKEIIKASKVVLAVGRDGTKWLEEIYQKHNIKTTNTQVDIGVRVETDNMVMEEINSSLYEGKFVYRTSLGTMVRTFCSNPSGHVVVENNFGVITANGHSYNDSSLGSNNTNFALLVSHHFSEPFSKPNEFAVEIASLANKLSCGSVIVQKYGDILKGRRTNAKRLAEGFVKPTLKEAVPGDLCLCLPYKTMQSIIETIEVLDKIIPGLATDHTLLYGVEAKFYSARPDINKDFEMIDIKGLFVAGDGAGLTRGLAQAGANGIYVARKILENI